MKLTIERAALLKSLGHVQSVVERRNTIPILNNVRIEARDGRLSLNATDMDLDIVETVNAEVPAAGATTAPAHNPLRHRAQAARRRRGGIGMRRRRRQARAPGGPVAVHPGQPADRRLPGHGGRGVAQCLRAGGAGSSRHDRSHPVRHLHRGNPLLPYRHLPARGDAGRRRRPARGCHRRPPTGQRRGAVACRCRRYARRHRASKGGRGIAQADRRDGGRGLHRAVGIQDPVLPSPTGS